MSTKQCVNCPGAVDHTTAECPVMRDEDLKIDTYALGPAHGFDTSRANMVRVTHKPTGISVERGTERSQYANRCAAQGALARLVGFSSGSILPPPTPEFVWVRLLETLHDDNGGAFTASTDDYREAKPALVQLIAAGFFLDDADSLDGDIWTVAAGEQGEAAARFASCSDAYAVLSGVLNRVFDRPEDAPSLPAAGSAVEEVEVVGYRWKSSIHTAPDLTPYAPASTFAPGYDYVDPLMTVAQHERIVAALSAQQSAPERVSVLCEALEDARRAMFAVLNQEPRMKAVAKRVLNAEIDRIDRALLASHGRGE